MSRRRWARPTDPNFEDAPAGHQVRPEYEANTATPPQHYDKYGEDHWVVPATGVSAHDHQEGSMLRLYKNSLAGSSESSGHSALNVMQSSRDSYAAHQGQRVGNRAQPAMLAQSRPMASAGPDPSTEKQMEYIKKLEERNRLKRRLRAKEEREKSESEAKEKGFSTQFSGANKSSTKRSQSAPSRKPKRDGSKERDRPVPVTERIDRQAQLTKKKWDKTEATRNMPDILVRYDEDIGVSQAWGGNDQNPQSPDQVAQTGDSNNQQAGSPSNPANHHEEQEEEILEEEPLETGWDQEEGRPSSEGGMDYSDDFEVIEEHLPPSTEASAGTAMHAAPRDMTPTKITTAAQANQEQPLGGQRSSVKSRMPLSVRKVSKVVSLQTVAIASSPSLDSPDVTQPELLEKKDSYKMRSPFPTFSVTKPRVTEAQGAARGSTSTEIQPLDDEVSTTDQIGGPAGGASLKERVEIDVDKDAHEERELADLALKLASLEPDKRRQMLMTLNQTLEAENKRAMTQEGVSLPTHKQELGTAEGAVEQGTRLGAMRHATMKVEAVSSVTESNTKDPNGVELVLKFLSSWSGGRSIGLNKVELLSTEGKLVEVPPTTVKVSTGMSNGFLSAGSTMVRDVIKLFTGDPKYIWVGRLPESGSLRVHITLPKYPELEYVRIYNYRQGSLTSVGVKELEVLMDGARRFLGDVPQASTKEPFFLVQLRGHCTNPDPPVHASSSKPEIPKLRGLPGSEPLNREGFDAVKRTSRSDSSIETERLSARQSSVHITRVGASASTIARPLWLDDLQITPRRNDELTSGAMASTHGRRRRQSTAVDGQISQQGASGEQRKGFGIGFASSSGEGNKLHEDALTARIREQTVAPLNPAKSNLADTSLSRSLESISKFERSQRGRLALAGGFHLEPKGVKGSFHDGDQESSAAGEGGSQHQSTWVSVMAENQPAFSAPGDRQLESKPTGVPAEGSKAHSAVSTEETQGTRIETIPRPSVVRIPELPDGQVLCISIESTWGDPHYVGLSGLEFFDSSGGLVEFRDRKTAIVAEPPDVNILPGYGDDPRTVDKLLDGKNFTCDDLHVWLAPFSEGECNQIWVTFDFRITLAMIRIWNYNKSRIHSYRGVRRIAITLDGILIFEGEIRKAPGLLTDPETSSEIILFTKDNAILSEIERHDRKVYDDETAKLVRKALQHLEHERPSTSDRKTGEDGGGLTSRRGSALLKKTMVPEPEESYEALYGKLKSFEGLSTAIPLERPKTAARPSVLEAKVPQSDHGLPMDPVQEGHEGSEPISRSMAGLTVGHTARRELLVGRRLAIELLMNWGDSSFVGLTGIEILDQNGVALPLSSSQIDGTPRDLATLGYKNDPRTIDKLLNRSTLTVDDRNMWLVPFTSGASNSIRLDLGDPKRISGLRIWNYNKSVDDSFRGVKFLRLYLDNEPVSGFGGLIIRKAPGTDKFEYGQGFSVVKRDGKLQFGPTEQDPIPPLKVLLREHRLPSNFRQDYEVPCLPQGFILKLVLWATWGDPYYIGLNGLAVYDCHGREITFREDQVFAHPASLRDPRLERHAQPNDVRLPGNLVNGRNLNSCDAWLAPLSTTLTPEPNLPPNTIWLVSDNAVSISAVKTPSRGVSHLEIWVDDLLVLATSLRQAPEPSTAAEQPGLDFSETILLGKPAALYGSTMTGPYCGEGLQHVLCINEGVIVEGKSLARSQTGVTPDLTARPMTGMVRSQS